MQGGPWKTLRGAPLFLYFYEMRISPAVRVNGVVEFEDWRLLELLIENGADLTLAEAAPLKEDLQKTSVRDVSGRFIQLR